MLKKWIEGLNFSASNDDADKRRKHERRNSESAIVDINGVNYAVENWSEGGLLLNGNDKMFSVDQPLHMKLKFKLEDRILEVEHFGKIIRKAANKVAVEFAPLTATVSQNFKRVIEDAVTREFAESPMA